MRFYGIYMSVLIGCASTPTEPANSTPSAATSSAPTLQSLPHARARARARECFLQAVRDTLVEPPHEIGDVLRNSAPVQASDCRQSQAVVAAFLTELKAWPETEGEQFLYIKRFKNILARWNP